jgi:hypothetical protein
MGHQTSSQPSWASLLARLQARHQGRQHVLLLAATAAGAAAVGDLRVRMGRFVHRDAMSMGQPPPGWRSCRAASSMPLRNQNRISERCMPCGPPPTHQEHVDALLRLRQQCLDALGVGGEQHSTRRVRQVVGAQCSATTLVAGAQRARPVCRLLRSLIAATHTARPSPGPKKLWNLACRSSHLSHSSLDSNSSTSV